MFIWSSFHNNGLHNLFSFHSALFPELFKESEKCPQFIILTSAQASVQAGGHRLGGQLRGVAAAAAGAGPEQAAGQAVALEQGTRAAAAPHQVLELETILRDVSSCTIIEKVLTG